MALRSWPRWAATFPLLFGFLLGLVLSPSVAMAQQRTDASKLDNQQAQKLFVRGMTESYLEDHEEAVTYFEKALEISPGEPSILMALAEAEEARNNVTSGLYYARQAREKASGRPYYAHQLAALLEEAERPQEAADTYQTLLATFPEYNEARLPLARLQSELDRPTEAISTYETYVDSVNRPDPEVYGEMLTLYERTGDEQALERTLQVLIRRHRTDRPYRKRLAELYLDQTRFEEAIPLLESLVGDTPNNPQLLSRLEKLYDKTGQTQQAEALWDRFAEKSAAPDQLVARARSLFEDARQAEGPLDSMAVRPARQLVRKALAQDSTHVGALDLLGTIQYETGAYTAAARALNRALDQNPRNPERWRRAAAAHLRAGQPQRAAAVGEEGLLLFPGRTDLLQHLGFARLRLDNPNAALSRFEAALKNLDETAPQRERAVLHAGLGLAQDRLGDVEQAEAAFDTALNLDPQAPQALRLYAESLARRPADLDRALALAQRAVEQAPNDPQTLATLGQVQVQRGALQDARSIFERALDAGEAPARVYEQFGDLHRKLGNDHLARRYWEKALDRAPAPDSLRKKLNALPQS